MDAPEAAKWKEAYEKRDPVYSTSAASSWRRRKGTKGAIWYLVKEQVGKQTKMIVSHSLVGCELLQMEAIWIKRNSIGDLGVVGSKGLYSTHEIDYQETFSPIAKIKLIRIMLAIAAFHDYEIWQMDVKTAFRNEKLTKDVFMAQPEGFENAKYSKRVCKFQKAIYGLKHVSRSWNLYFHEKVTQFGFFRSKDESYIYVKVSGSVVVFLVLYVDDILLIGNDILTLQSVKDWLGKCFAMKYLGDATYILGIKIYMDRSKRLIGLSQDA
ncbi:retrotransposon protein, putative, ty1-copia subclass [Tanacetum coccineum]